MIRDQFRLQNAPVTYFAAAVVLAAYGYLVNKPDSNFGELLRTYVAFFFLVAQVLGLDSRRSP